MDKSLLLLANEVRSKTLWLLDGLTDEAAQFAAPGLANTLLWHGGHIFVVVECLGVAPASGQPPALPAGWFDAFSWDSDPRAVTQWPKLADVRAALSQQLPRLTAAIAPLTSEQLDQTIGPPHDAPLRYLLVHGLHDEANHQGEMWVLRKMLNKSAAS